MHVLMCSMFKKCVRKAFLPLKKAKFLPAAQPWWAAGCAVTGVGGRRRPPLKKMLEEVL